MNDIKSAAAICKHILLSKDLAEQLTEDEYNIFKAFINE